MLQHTNGNVFMEIRLILVQIRDKDIFPRLFFAQYIDIRCRSNPREVERKGFALYSGIATKEKIKRSCNKRMNQIIHVYLPFQTYNCLRFFPQNTDILSSTFKSWKYRSWTQNKSGCEMLWKLCLKIKKMCID